MIYFTVSREGMSTTIGDRVFTAPDGAALVRRLQHLRIEDDCVRLTAGDGGYTQWTNLASAAAGLAAAPVREYRQPAHADGMPLRHITLLRR
jgi:hypothetical protein